MPNITHERAVPLGVTYFALRGMCVEENTEERETSFLLDGVACSIAFYLDVRDARNELPAYAPRPLFLNEEIKDLTDPVDGIFVLPGLNLAALGGAYGASRLSESWRSWFGLPDKNEKGQVCKVSDSLPEKALKGVATFGLKSLAQRYVGNDFAGKAISAVVAGGALGLAGQGIASEREQWKMLHDKKWKALSAKLGRVVEYRIDRLTRELTEGASYRLKSELAGRIRLLVEFRSRLQDASPPADPADASQLNAILEESNLHVATYFAELKALNEIRRSYPGHFDQLKRAAKGITNNKN